MKKNAGIADQHAYSAFDDPERLEKERCLEDMLKYLSTGGSSGNHKPIFTEECYMAIMRLVETNLLRCPPLKFINPMEVQDDEEEPNLENQWPHIVLVYMSWLVKKR